MRKRKSVKKPVGDSKRLYAESVAKILEFWFWPKASTEAMDRAGKDIEKHFEQKFFYNSLVDRITFDGRFFYPEDPKPESRLTEENLASLRAPGVSGALLSGPDYVHSSNVLTLTPEEAQKMKMKWDAFNEISPKTPTTKRTESEELFTPIMPDPKLASTWDKVMAADGGDRLLLERFPDGTSVAYTRENVEVHIPEEYQRWLRSPLHGSLHPLHGQRLARYGPVTYPPSPKEEKKSWWDRLWS